MVKGMLYTTAGVAKLNWAFLPPPPLLGVVLVESFKLIQS